MNQHRGWSHGATFDKSKILAALASAEWEDEDSSDYEGEVKRVYLGTIFGLTPSGKFYASFACSNVAGDCPACNGVGSIVPRTGKRTRKRAKRRSKDLCKGVMTRGGWYMGTGLGAPYAVRVKAYRDHATRVADTSCNACDGMGSISAARDARWSEALEALATSMDAFVDYQDDSIFIAQCRDKQSDEMESEAS